MATWEDNEIARLKAALIQAAISLVHAGKTIGATKAYRDATGEPLDACIRWTKRKKSEIKGT